MADVGRKAIAQVKAAAREFLDVEAIKGCSSEAWV